jgi:hypothetical protein
MANKNIKPPPSSSSTFLSPGMIPSLALPPWVSSSTAAQDPVQNAIVGFSLACDPTSDEKKMCSLGDFFHLPLPPLVPLWSASQKVEYTWPNLIDIQQEVQANHSKEHG